MAGNVGSRAYFALDSSIAVLTAVSTWLTGVQLTDSTDEIDVTTLQPGVTTPIKETLGGFSDKGIQLSVNYTPSSYTFFNAISRATALNYQYGPLGNTAGMVKIYGLCNHISNSGPDSSVGSPIPMTVSLKATTQIAGTF